MIALLLAAALSFPEISERADELGMIDSPEAFVAACGLALNPYTAEMQAEYAKLNKAEQEDATILMGTMAVGCASMIRGVAETISTAPAYVLPGGKQVCIDSSMQTIQVMKKATEIAKAQPALLNTEGLTSPGFVLYVLSELSNCPAK